MLIKRAWLKICVSIVTAVALLFCGFFVGNLVNHRLLATEKVESKDQAVSSEQQDTVLLSFDVKKTPMTHTDTLSFSWKAPEYGAKITDYLAPQLREIFKVCGIETTEFDVFDIQEDVAKHSPYNHNFSHNYHPLMRCFQVKNSRGAGISFVCYTLERLDDIFFSVQVIHKTSVGFDFDDVNDFKFADFNGDGVEEVYTSSSIIGDSSIITDVGVFPFSDSVWGKPLFWTGYGEGPLPYDYGFSRTGDKTKITIKNNYTGYSRTILQNSDKDKDVDLATMPISTETAADVDGDGIYELIVMQDSFQSGNCFSLLKFNTKKKQFETINAAYLTFDEAGQDGFKSFLQKAGYKYSKVKFLD